MCLFAIPQKCLLLVDLVSNCMHYSKIKLIYVQYTEFNGTGFCKEIYTTF